MTSFDIFNQESLWVLSTPVPRTKRRTPETTHMSDSYQTVSETPEPTKEPVITPLEQKTPKKPIIDINTMAPADVVMTDNKEMKTTELKLSPPKPFTGKREEPDDFIQDVYLYLIVNSNTYNTNKKKIGYMLSFMNNGDAKSWKAQFL